MIRISKRTLLSILTLVLTLVALGTTSFAWFTLSNVTTISNITANVQAGEGLEVALGINEEILTNYKNNLNANDWQKVIDKLPEFRLNAVTTNDLTNFYKLSFKNTDEVLKPGLYQEEALRNTDYLEFLVYFKSNSGGDIYFNEYSFIDEPKLFTPRVQYDKDNTGINEVAPFNAYASNAVRIAVENEVYQNGSNGGTNIHTSNSGVRYGQFSYLTEMKNDIYWHHDLNFKKLGTVTDNETLNIEDISILEAETSLSSNLEKVATLVKEEGESDYKARITIRVWIEGFDADAYDSLFGARLQLSLSFKKQEII